MTKAKKSGEFELAPRITAKQYREWEQAVPPARAEIAAMVKCRFEARFIEPVTEANRVRGGFAAVALGCLAIQALDSFRNRDTSTAGALERFFQHNPEFVTLRGHERKFYENVRNALHHQAQTRGGWRIHISGPVFDKELRVLGAQAFVDGFRQALARYCAEITASADNSHLWKNLVAKMAGILAACDDEVGTDAA